MVLTRSKAGQASSSAAGNVQSPVDDPEGTLRRARRARRQAHPKTGSLHPQRKPSSAPRQEKKASSASKSKKKEFSLTTPSSEPSRSSTIESIAESLTWEANESRQEADPESIHPGTDRPSHRQPDQAGTTTTAATPLTTQPPCSTNSSQRGEEASEGIIPALPAILNTTADADPSAHALAQPAYSADDDSAVMAPGPNAGSVTKRSFGDREDEAPGRKRSKTEEGSTNQVHRIEDLVDRLGAMWAPSYMPVLQDETSFPLLVWNDWASDKGFSEGKREGAAIVRDALAMLLAEGETMFSAGRRLAMLLEDRYPDCRSSSQVHPQLQDPSSIEVNVRDDGNSAHPDTEGHLSYLEALPGLSGTSADSAAFGHEPSVNRNPNGETDRLETTSEVPAINLDTLPSHETEQNIESGFSSPTGPTSSTPSVGECQPKEGSFTNELTDLNSNLAQSDSNRTRSDDLQMILDRLDQSQKPAEEAMENERRFSARDYPSIDDYPTADDGLDQDFEDDAVLPAEISEQDSDSREPSKGQSNAAAIDHASKLRSFESFEREEERERMAKKELNRELFGDEYSEAE